VNAKEILRAMCRWVERERRRLEKTGERKSQQFLRRSRLVRRPITVRELGCELRTLRA